MSETLRPHELQQARPTCPSPTPRVHSDSRPLSRWCHQPSHLLSSSSPPAPNPSQHQSLFQWVNSSHEVAKVLEFPALASVLPKNTQDRSPLEWTGWISLQSKGLSRVFSNTTVQQHLFIRNPQIFDNYQTSVQLGLMSISPSYFVPLPVSSSFPRTDPVYTVSPLQPSPRSGVNNSLNWTAMPCMQPVFPWAISFSRCDML